MRHMLAIPSGSSARSTTVRGTHKRLTAWLLGVALALGGTGCGVEAGLEAGVEELGTQEAAEVVDNGLSTNGLSTNGLSTNGLSTNGLSTNGLTASSFLSWFDGDTSHASALMTYVVRCAVSAGQTRGFTHPRTGVTYSWAGGLGLAPGWASGLAATQLEKEVVTACLAAHVNKYAVQVSVSVLGRNAQGTAIPYTATELSTYSVKEACFFGNVFDTNGGVYAAIDRAYLTSAQTSTRACGLASSAGPSDCSPLVHVGACATYCTLAPSANGSEPYYAECTYNGKTYQPITTRIRPQEIFSCGDGTCQFTESCGTGTTYNSCQADCGTCP
ncbi:MAG TPA: hypothetical protein VE153_11260 [Myxococcus sp.]|nr:hypothetical protein [Myxococcus sp.]